MTKRFLIVSSLLLSVPAWAAGQAGVSEAGQAEPPAVSSTAAAGLETAAADGKVAADSRAALLAERQARQRELFQLRAQRDSKLSRLSLARLAASRGGDSEFDERKDKAMQKEMHALEQSYNQKLAEVQAGIDRIDARLARLDEQECQRSQGARDEGKHGGDAAAPAGGADRGE